ncbi:MAG: ZIP family metal transporter [Clostridiales bacterium]|nr:ZIP family metal transporter [Clostridiales bacterium]
MTIYLLTGLLLPFAGTTLGAACVFFLKNELKAGVQKTLLGFASGVMVAASVWSLLIPSMEMSENMDRFSFVPALIGLLAGFMFLLLMDIAIPHLHLGCDQAEGPKCGLPRTTMLLLAVTLHNIPEGMAVGVVFAGVLSGEAQITSAGALALAIGIAIQNFPEGAVISLPLRGGMPALNAQEENSKGMSRPKAFLCGTLSGIVEPISAVITILLSRIVTPVLPYLLSFAAGAMLYVVVEELIPEASTGEHSNLGTIGFAVGFALMMVLDVALG